MDSHVGISLASAAAKRRGRYGGKNGLALKEAAKPTTCAPAPSLEVAPSPRALGHSHQHRRRQKDTPGATTGNPLTATSSSPAGEATAKTPTVGIAAAVKREATIDQPGKMPHSQWERYPSINDVDLWQLHKIRTDVEGSDVVFVALEKVHGSNFAFETNGVSVQYFSRNRRLDRQELFVGKTRPQEAMQQYHKAVLATFPLCASKANRPVQSVIIYGEYFGGWYPHEQVKQEGPGAGAPVQKGIVAYSPTHHFYAFDVCVDGRFLDFDEATEVLSEAGFPLIATPVVRGSFNTCMDFDVESFRTTIPQLLGLPPCENYAIAEGLVIRPVQRRQQWTVKRKSVRYLEECPLELRKWVSKCAESKEDAFLGLYLCLCRQPRLDAVLSKEPQLRKAPANTLPKVQQLFWQDLEEAFQKKLREINLVAPPGCSKAAREEADRRVSTWLLGDKINS